MAELPDATAVSVLIADGSVSAAEAVEAAITRIEKLNPTLNAVIHERFDAAQGEAAAGPRGPFAGVPFLVKDAVCHTAGDPYHLGMRALRDRRFFASHDTWLAQRFRAAGFVFVGRTNVPELASALTTEPLAYGPTRNPWDLGRSTGGSSGGSAAAVAAGMVPVAHGNDMGGSIRFPAAMCGVVGLKPTRARTTLGPDLGELWGPLTHEFVLTRSVRDAAGVLDAVAGPGIGDPYTAPAPAERYTDALGKPPPRLRIGFLTSRRDGGSSHPDCAAAVEDTARLLDDLGHTVGPVTIDALDASVDAAFGLTVMVGIAREVARWNAVLGEDISGELEPANAFLVEAGGQATAQQYVAALDTMHAWSRRVSAWWTDHDVLVLPVSPEPPLPLGVIGPENTDDSALMRLLSLTSFTVPFDVTGQPAISLPLHWNDDGLPIGVQLVAAYGREDVLLRVAAQLEDARPWAPRRPPTTA